MINLIHKFFENNVLQDKKHIIISMDLDNTLIIRDKGSNYVNKNTKALLEKLIKEFDVALVPNTGREIIGFSSFKKDVFYVKNAILSSGSLIINEDKLFVDKNGLIEKNIVYIFLEAVKNNVIPFIDISDISGRKIFYNKDGLLYKKLFFSQNPKEWFYGKLPPSLLIDCFENYDFNNVFRIELPILSNKYKKLHNRLIQKLEYNIEELSEILSVETNILINYNLKRKVFFCDDYTRDEVIFSRFEKNAKFVNKGTGLKKWLEIANINTEDSFIIHVGDQDSGLINDTIIKSSVPSASLVMVGDKCSLNKPEVDLYLRGDVENNLLLFLNELYNNLKKYDKR